jgi:hypothetical protein
MNRVVILADAMEKVLIRMYRGEALPDESLITLLLSCCAQMRMLIGQTSPDWIANTQWKNKTTEDKLLSQLNDISSSLSCGMPGN